MKRLLGVFTLAAFFSVANLAQARTPLTSDMTSDMVGAVPFVGAGFRTEVLEFPPRHATHIRLRVPNHCAIQIAPITVLGEPGRAVGRLVTSLNDGTYAHWVYALNNGMGQEVDTVKLGLSSAFRYFPRHQCGVRVWVSTATPLR